MPQGHGRAVDRHIPRLLHRRKLSGGLNKSVRSCGSSRATLVITDLIIAVASSGAPATASARTSSLTASISSGKRRRQAPTLCWMSPGQAGAAPLPGVPQLSRPQEQQRACETSSVAEDACGPRPHCLVRVVQPGRSGSRRHPEARRRDDRAAVVVGVLVEVVREAVCLLLGSRRAFRTLVDKGQRPDGTFTRLHMSAQGLGSQSSSRESHSPSVRYNGGGFQE